MSMRVLVTGGAGFIGSHLSAGLAGQGHEVVAVDALLDNYSVSLKRARVSELLGDRVDFRELDLGDGDEVASLFEDIEPEVVVHLAARPGVREGLSSLGSYLRHNILAFGNVLEQTAVRPGCPFLYASSSSVYGDFPVQPLVESAVGIRPKSYYGATKLADELIGDAVIRQSESAAVGFRFFTVYGPWGRPDMLPWRASAAALFDLSFPLFGDGTVLRDFTYIDDVVESISRVAGLSRTLEPRSHRILNVGGGSQRSVIDLLRIVEQQTGCQVPFNRQPAINVDVASTLADAGALDSLTGFTPGTDLETGMAAVIEWMHGHPNQIPEWSGGGLRAKGRV